MRLGLVIAAEDGLVEMSKLEVAAKVLEDVVATPGCNAQFDLLASNIGSFCDRVVYIDLADDEGMVTLRTLADEVKQRLHAAGVCITNLDQGFTPHITVAKTSKVTDWKKAKNLKFTPDVLAHLEGSGSSGGGQVSVEQEATVLHIKSLQLCRMQGKSPGAYYPVEKEAFFCFGQDQDHL